MQPFSLTVLGRDEVASIADSRSVGAVVREWIMAGGSRLNLRLPLVVPNN